jgi:hypothetical protein
MESHSKTMGKRPALADQKQLWINEPWVKKMPSLQAVE